MAADILDKPAPTAPIIPQLNRPNSYMTLFLRVLVYNVLMPTLAWLCPLYAGWGWLERDGDLRAAALAGVLVLILSCAFAYRNGYERFFKTGRKWCFALVFVLPNLIGGIGVLIAFIISTGTR